MAPQRDNQFKILLSDEELQMLRELAEHEGLTASDYVRRLIREKHENDLYSKPFEKTLEELADRAAAIGGDQLPGVKKLRAAAKKIRKARKGLR